MTRRAIVTRVERIFREVFGDPTLVLREAMTPTDILTWDSLAHINMVIALEAEFAVAFTSEEVVSVVTVGDLVDLLEQKTASDVRA